MNFDQSAELIVVRIREIEKPPKDDGKGARTLSCAIEVAAGDSSVEVLGTQNSTLTGHSEPLNLKDTGPPVSLASGVRSRRINILIVANGYTNGSSDGVPFFRSCV
jgi:hypothetical protein